MSAAPPDSIKPNSSVATTVLAALAIVAMLWFGRSFLIPLTAGLMLALLVGPVVVVLTRLLRVRFVAVIATLALVITVIGLAAGAFGEQLARVAGRAPDMINLVALQVADTEPRADSVLRRARDAFRELDRAADRFSGLTAPAPVKPPPLLRPPRRRPSRRRRSASHRPPRSPCAKARSRARACCSSSPPT